ncbi:MAG TPA: DUF2231 domain-containing protein [Candidatus Binatia bacterium]|nr:DUF2231 domain-containing protein [Candidatus Binatia bacterium]
MPQPKVRNPQFAVRSPNEKVRPWALTLLFMPLLLNCAGITWAQDDVPVPPLEAGTLLTFHPICVHFATALTVFGLALDWAGSWRHQTQWQSAGRLSFFAGVVAIGLAVLSGWIEQELPRPASAFDSQIHDVLFYHEYLGYGLLGIFLMLAIARSRIHNRLPVAFVVLSALGLVGLIVQGYLGGDMVYRYGAGVRAVQILSSQLSDGEQKKAPKD